VFFNLLFFSSNLRHRFTHCNHVGLLVEKDPSVVSCEHHFTVESVKRYELRKVGDRVLIKRRSSRDLPQGVAEFRLEKMSVFPHTIQMIEPITHSVKQCRGCRMPAESGSSELTFGFEEGVGAFSCTYNSLKTGDGRGDCVEFVRSYNHIPKDISLNHRRNKIPVDYGPECLIVRCVVGREVSHVNVREFLHILDLLREIFKCLRQEEFREILFHEFQCKVTHHSSTSSYDKHWTVDQTGLHVLAAKDIST